MQGDIQSVLDRIEKLEKENRRLKRVDFIVLLVCLSAALIFMLAGKHSLLRSLPVVQENGSIRAKAVFAGEFHMVDKSGTLRGSLIGSLPDYTLASFQGPDGKQSISMFLSNDGASLGINYPKDKATSSVGEAAVELNLYGGQFPRVSINYPSGKEATAIGMQGPHPFVALMNEAGKSLVELNGGGRETGLRISDENGYEAAIGQTSLVSTRTGQKNIRSAASLVLYDKNGKVLWSAP